MLQTTVNRLSGLDIQSPITICNEEHRFFVAEQLREIDKLGSIILEPVGRNTAPAIALAALTAKDDPLLLVLAADHVIQDEDAFREAVIRAIPLAEAGKLVTFGIVPSAPHTGYGYIKRGKDIGEGFEVDAFVEKPSSDVAQDYFSSGDYYWNSGMFLFRASNYLEELKKFRPDILEQCQGSVMDVKTDLDFLRIDKDIFESCPAESVDYAVMEKTSHAVVVPMDAGWSDIGSWSSLWDISEKDSEGNSTHGDVILHNTHNSM
jgi:mannose-1-phosphate guanylyltransferase